MWISVRTPDGQITPLFEMDEPHFTFLQLAADQAGVPLEEWIGHLLQGMVEHRLGSPEPIEPVSRGSIIVPVADSLLEDMTRTWQQYTDPPTLSQYCEAEIHYTSEAGFVPLVHWMKKQGMEPPTIARELLDESERRVYPPPDEQDEVRAFEEANLPRWLEEHTVPSEAAG